MDDSPTYDNTDRESDSELDSLYDALKQHDDIRFATYRTAAKLRYIQRKAFLHHIDIWNMIEAFRENGLNTLEPTTLVNRARMETLLSSLYSNLNKRLPPGQNIDIEKVGPTITSFPKILALLPCFRLLPCCLPGFSSLTALMRLEGWGSSQSKWPWLSFPVASWWTSWGTCSPSWQTATGSWYRGGN